MRAVAVMALVLGLARPAFTQDVPAPPPPEQQPDTPQIDPTKLGVSLTRIQKGLRLAEVKDKAAGQGLRLEFNVQVFGVAPRIDVIPDGEDLVFGVVPDSAPTHREYLEFVTPQIFRTPTMPISTFAAWAAKWMADKSKKARCEEEIANYRALIMQGVNVAAPRCTQ
jgi:hypothetical protein